MACKLALHIMMENGRAGGLAPLGAKRHDDDWGPASLGAEQCKDDDWGLASVGAERHDDARGLASLGPSSTMMNIGAWLLGSRAAR
eukprot:5659283-Amphidinium_carterae.2